MASLMRLLDNESEYPMDARAKDVIAQICRQRGMPLLVDDAQRPVDVRRIDTRGATFWTDAYGFGSLVVAPKHRYVARFARSC